MRWMVPKQRSSGGKARLFGISKRGDRYIRTLMIHGARAVLGKAHGKTDPKSLWIGQMRERRHPNVVAVALNVRAAIRASPYGVTTRKCAECPVRTNEARSPVRFLVRQSMCPAFHSLRGLGGQDQRVR